MFAKALPIWLAGKEKEMNIQAKFVANFIGKENIKLKITGATYYKVFLNGKLIHYGPSPTARSYARVDIVNLDAVEKGNNVIMIEAVGYNCFSYATDRQALFKQKYFVTVNVWRQPDLISKDTMFLPEFKIQ